MEVFKGLFHQFAQSTYIKLLIDMKRCRQAIHILELCPLIDMPDDNQYSLCGISDLHVLLLLATENMAEHRVFRYCLDAKKMAASMKKADTPYLDMMVTKTAWGMQDAADDQADEVLKKFTN